MDKIDAIILKKELTGYYLYASGAKPRLATLAAWALKLASVEAETFLMKNVIPPFFLRDDGNFRRFRGVLDAFRGR